MRQAELTLAGYLLTITDGYNRVGFRDAWGAHTDPDWGTIMGHRIDVDGHQADFLFRCCHGEDRRLLAVTLDALFFSALRLHYRSLWAAVLAHGFGNTLGLVTFFAVGPVRGLW